MFGIFGKFFGWLFSRFGDLFKSEAIKFAAKHKDLFIRIVLDLAFSSLSGEEKRRTALLRAKDSLRGVGEEARDHFFGLALEMVVAELKAQGRIP